MLIGWIVGAVLIAWVVPIPVANAMGKAKHRDGSAYGIFLGWLGVLILAVLPSLPEKTAAEKLAQLERAQASLKTPDYARRKAELEAELAAEDSHRECPFCKEPMRKDATVCPHCRHESVALIASVA